MQPHTGLRGSSVSRARPKPYCRIPASAGPSARRVRPSGRSCGPSSCAKRCSRTSPTSTSYFPCRRCSVRVSGSIANCSPSWLSAPGAPSGCFSKRPCRARGCLLPSLPFRPLATCSGSIPTVILWLHPGRSATMAHSRAVRSSRQAYCGGSLRQKCSASFSCAA